MVEVYAVKLSERFDSLKSAELLMCVSDERRNRIKGVRKDEHAQEILIADILARYVICKKLRIKNSELSFDINEYGKPFVRDYSECHFSVSHSRTWVVCASHTSPVGIDIEAIQPIDYCGIAKRFFTKVEYYELMSKKYSKRQSYFFDLWTIKESYVKAKGKGLSIPLNSFSIRIHNNDIRIETGSKNEDHFFKQYHVDDDYRMAVCATTKEFMSTVRIEDIDEVCDEVLRNLGRERYVKSLPLI